MVAQSLLGLWSNHCVVSVAAAQPVKIGQKNSWQHFPMLMGSLCKPPFQLPGIGGLSLRAGNTRFGRPVSANPSFRVSSTRPSCRARAGQAKVAAVAKTSAKPKKQEEPGFDTDNVNFVEDYRAVKVATFRVVSKEDKAKLDGAHKHLFAADGFEDFGSWLEQLGDVQTSHHRCVGRRGAAKQTAKASVGTSVESVVEGDTAASERGECEGASSIGRATRGVKGLVFGAGRPSMIGGTSAACQSGRKSPERSGEGDAGQFRTAPTMGASESRLFKYASEGGRSGRGELVGATSKRSDSDIGEIDSTSDSAWKQYAPRRGVGASAGQRGGAERGAGSSSGGRGEKEFGLQGEADVLTGGTGRAVLAGGMGEAECAEGKTEPLSRRKFQGESSGVGSGSGGGALPRKNSEADSMTEQRAPKKRGRPPKQGKDVGVSRGAEAAASSEGIGEAIPSGGVRLVASLRGNAGAGFSGRLEAESWSKARDRSRREGAYTDEGLRPIVAMKDRDLGAEDVSSVGKNEGAWSINEYLAGGLKSRNNGLPSEEPVRQPRKRGRKPGTKKASVVPVDGFQHCRVSDTANVSRTEQSQVEAAVDRGARCSGDGAVLRSEDRTQDKSVQNDGAGSGRGENEGRGGELWERIGEPFETLQAGHRIQDDTALGGFSVSGKRDSLVDSGSVAAETVGMTGLPKQGPASQLGPAAEAVQMGRRIRTDRKPAVSEVGF